MHIDPSSMIARLPAVAVRDFLRTAGSSEFYAEWASDRLGLDLRRTTRVLDGLVRLALLRLADSHGERERCYERTLDGATLALASAAKPFTRASADEHLERFLQRVRAVNKDETMLFQVKLVYLFGSMLRDAQFVNDVDVAVELIPRYGDKAQQKATCEKRVKDAMKAGRRFGNIVEEIFWPRTEVMLKLKARSRSISLHTTDDEILQTAPKRLIYDQQAD